jgi:tetratricopeptide (TPR) repeat protein
MTNQSLEATQEIMSYDERLEILARELELAVKWQRPCILLVVYSSEYVRLDVESALDNYLIDLGQKAVHLQLKDQRTESVVSFLKEFKDPTNVVFLVNGLHWALDGEKDAYSTINLQREFFVERQIRAIFWLTENEIVNLARFAPEFWAYRHRVIEFTESPKPERLLQEALDSAWQGTGEYADEYEDTDAKISLRESLLTDLPAGEEASALRANLLLTLSILNWRKGDYEKAGEQLQEALKIAARIEDSWFEAECYNALALLKTSMDRTDEAIDAYKKAIHLAPDQIFAWNNLGNLCARIGRNDEAMVAFRKAVECNPKDPIAWNGLANLHFRIGYMDDAVTAYRKAIQYMPTFAQPWNGLGDVYAGMGRIDEALKAYYKSVELNGKYITPWVRLAVLYARQDRYRDAAKAYQRALALDAHNSLLWNDLGTIHIKNEALDDAAEAFSKAIELDRGFGWAYSNLAYTYMLQGKYRKTVSLFLRSIELLESDKDKAVSWNRLGSVYRLLDDYENAIEAYQMADQLDATSPAARQRAPIDPDDVARASKRAEQRAEQPEVEVMQVTPVSSAATPAPAALPTEQTTKPVAPAPKILDAPSWLFNSQPEDAPAAPEQASKQPAPEPAVSAAAYSPTPVAPIAEPAPAPAAPVAASTPTATEPSGMDAAKWTNEGNLRFSRAEVEAAIDAYNQAIQLDPQFGLPYSNLALAYLTQGHFAEAILLYKKSIDLLATDQDKAVSWNGLGNAYRCVNDYANAIAAYQHASELDPATAGIRDRADDFQSAKHPRGAREWNDLGELFAKTGSSDEAIDAFQRAIDMQPQDGKSYGNLAQELVNQSKYQEAIPLYQKSIELLQDNKEKATAWNRLGNVYRKLNDYDNAIKAYQKAVALADEGVDLLTRTRFSLLSNCYVNP